MNGSNVPILESLKMMARESLTPLIERVQNMVAEGQTFLGMLQDDGSAIGNGVSQAPRRGRPPGQRGRRTLSAKARKAIGDAQRRRWAKQRKGNGRTVKASSTRRPRRRLSMQARNRIAAAQRARWAKLRKGNGRRKGVTRETSAPVQAQSAA